MYTREILSPVPSPVENGNPLTGTWTRAFDKVDLLEITRPFAWPLPLWVRNSRIKEWHSFTAKSEDILFEAVFCNFKLYRIAQVSIYDNSNNEKYSFRKVIYGTLEAFAASSGWILGSLYDSSVEAAEHENDQSAGFNFRIHSKLSQEKISLYLDIPQSRRRIPFTCNLEYMITSQCSPMAVSLGITERRTMYAFKALAPVSGEINLGGRNIKFNQENCSGFFCDYKGFFFYRTQIVLCSAMGFKETAVRFGFHIVENKIREPNKNNENALWVNGELTPLPPVLITMPYGPEGIWVIQDVEGMIDLTFTPKEQTKSAVKLIFTNADLNAQIGYYNGIILNKDREQVQIKNLLGTGEKIKIRV